MRRGTKTWEQSREIQRLAAEGLSTREIAKAMSLSQARVARIATKFNLILAKGRHRRLAFYTPEARFQKVRELAAMAGISPATMLDRILSTVVDEGTEIARRRLGKLARPLIVKGRTDGE